MKRIPLSRGMHAIVDDEDFDRIAKHKWHVQSDTMLYAVRKGPRDEHGKRIRYQMHREVISAPAGIFVDHISGDPLDNRRCNLRLATTQQNAFNQKVTRTNNTTGAKGVFLCRATGRYYAQICINGRGRHLGFFASIEEASAAYDTAARLAFGEFAKTNATINQSEVA